VSESREGEGALVAAARGGERAPSLKRQSEASGGGGKDKYQK
jgi:hypothetical protein